MNLQGKSYDRPHFALKKIKHNHNFTASPTPPADVYDLG